MYDDGYVDEVVGIDMVDDGMMRYEEGVILTEMGMPGLGMAQMQMGQREMIQGEALMDVGMMENAMGYGGYGMGYQNGALIAAEQALLLANTGYVCMGVGCTYPCCVRRCPPGCMLPCCRKQIIVVNNQQQYNQPPVVYQQQKFVPQQQQFIPPQQQVRTIFSGSLYFKHNFSWNYVPNAMVTQSHFCQESLSMMSKLKIKKQILHNDCFFLKTSHFNTPDHFYAVPRHEQINWFCSIIWSKLQLERHYCDLNKPFNGFIEGRILRKSQFLGQWAFREVIIDHKELMSYRSRNQAPSTIINRINELWTRFELIEQQMYLVIKMHSNGTKYEYAVPVQDAVHWIKAFFSLMR